MRSPLTLTACFAVAVVMIAGCGNDIDPDRIHASGHIEATEVRLAAKTSGRLLEAPFQEGDAVRSGEVVARLEAVDLELQLARLRAEAGAAEAQLALLLEGTRREDLRRAEEALAQAQAELDAATRDVARLEGLADRGTATAKARDDARTRREVAERAVAGTRAELDKLIAGPRRQEIEAARWHQAAADAAVAAVEQQVRDATVVAPCAGIVTARVAEPGEMLAPGSVIAVLTDLSRPWLTVWVDEPSLAWVRLGEPVEVRVDGVDRDFPGTVTFVSPVAEFTPKNVQTPAERAKLVFRVKIALDNEHGLFKPGLPADAFIVRGEVSGG